MPKLKFNKRQINKKQLKKKNPKPFFSSGAYGCVYYPEFTCLGKRTNRKFKENISKLTINNFYTKNEVEISNIIRKRIKDKHLLGIHRSCNVSKGKLEQFTSEHSCPIVEKEGNKNDYVLLYSRFIDNVEASDFMDVYSNMGTMLVLMDVVTSKIIKFQKHGIVHNDLHFGNILIEKRGNEKSLKDLYHLSTHFRQFKKRIYIIDYGLSLQKDKFYVDGALNKSYLKKLLIGFDPSWKYSSLDFIMLTYCLYNNRALSASVVKQIIRHHVNNNEVFQRLPSSFVTNYTNQAIKYYTDLTASKSPDDIIRKCLTFWNTWDLYHLCIKYLSIIQTVHIRNYKLIMLCLMGIHYDPHKRPSVQEFKGMMIDVTNSRTHENSTKITLSKMELKMSSKSRLV